MHEPQQQLAAQTNMVACQMQAGQQAMGHSGIKDASGNKCRDWLDIAKAILHRTQINKAAQGLRCHWLKNILQAL